MKKNLKNIKFHPVTAILFLSAVVVCAILAFNGIQSDWTLATFAPCLGVLGANIDQDCDNPRVRGYESTALIFNRDDIDWSAVTYDPSNRRIVKTIAAKTGAKPYVIYNPRTNPAPMNGTNSAFTQDTDNYTKTLQFYFEGIGGAAAKDVVEPLKSGSYVVVLQRKDHRGEGSFPILGFNSGLVATAEVQDEDTGYWLITMTCEERFAEVELLDTDYETTKTKFDALVALA